METILLFNNIEEFNTWHSLVNEDFGYPNIETKTDKYTESILHPIDNRVICYIDDKCPEDRLIGQNIVTYEWCKTEGWFYEEELI